MVVNVYTEWAPLKEVIIGDSINFNHEQIDKIFQYIYIDQIDKSFSEKINYSVAKKYILERQEDLDNFAKILEKRGIVVKRPKKLTKLASFRTPYFRSVMSPIDSPRDMFFCIGNEIIETPPTNRKRYFEGLLLYDVFNEYFRGGSRWTLAPRPRLFLNTLDFTYWKEVNKLHELDGIEKKYEICFDAANCLKFGKDIIMNVGNKNHELGAVWLQRHLGNDFRVHKIRFTDNHIDGTIMPLRPNLLLVNKHFKDKLKNLPKFLQKWKVLEVSEEYVNKDFNYPFNYPSNHLQLASFLGMVVNVLSIDENTVCVNKKHVKLIKLLESEGFEVIPVQLRHSELFGGGLHCVSLDVRREEKIEDYI